MNAVARHAAVQRVEGARHTCDGLTRRDFLQAGTLGAIGLSLVDYAALKAAGAVSKDHDERSVIMIFNLGAPSQLDFWDMKPDAPAEIRGRSSRSPPPRRRSRSPRSCPGTRDIADKFSLVRSCYHTAAAVHDTGQQMMQTGRLFTGGVNTPHAGCVLSYLRGRRTDLPAHVLLPEPMGRTGGNLPHGQDAGFLGKAHDPFALNADPSKPNFQVPDLLPPKQIGEVRLDRRRKLRDDRRRHGRPLRGESERATARQQLRVGLPPDDQRAGARRPSTCRKSPMRSASVTA